MGRSSTGTCRCWPSPTTNCATTRSHVRARSWGSEPLPGREHPHTQTPRPGSLIAPEAPEPPA
eukprot:6118343-Alexandrium_andersonii.AAC.1